MRKINFILAATIGLMAVGCSKKTINEPVGLNHPGAINAQLSSAPGDVVGKVTVGYQGWFSCAGDGSPINAYGSHVNLENWPDMRQYSASYGSVPFYQAGVQQAPYTGNLGDGNPAKLFSSDDQQVVNTHVLWMQQSGIDCIAIQRFGSYTTAGSVKGFHDAVQLKVMNAAQTYRRKFYIMYDCSATDPVETDWTNTIVNTQHLTSSSAYAHQNGKPVVALWGVGVSGRGSVTDWENTINWFKNQGCYVIVCPLDNFSTDTPNQPAYNAGNMIMAWMVGKRASVNWQNIYTTDLNYCNAHGLDYQGDMYPGYAFNNTEPGTKPKNEIPRTHGNFMWSQFAGGYQAGIQSVYVSMFDEMNEGTAVFNLAEDSGGVPAGKYFLTLDADGTHMSSDFYLRLINDGGKMIKKQIAYTATVFTPFVFTAPASLTPHVLSSTSIQINWSQVTDAPCYNVKRSATSGGPYTTVAAGVTGGTYTNTGLTANTTYYYVISTGHINGGESVNSAQVSAKTNP
jgi:hypothetical protein